MTIKRFPIEASHIMMLARSIGDDNQLFYDADYAKKTEPGTIIAPPTFVQSSAQFDPDYFLRPKTGQAWFGSGKEPTGVKRSKRGGGGAVDCTPNNTRVHRQVKVGDVLTATTKPGKTWEKEGKRSGKLVFSESITEYRDQKGELVVTARGVGVRTERPVDQK
jgi:acyl dehydratase